MGWALESIFPLIPFHHICNLNITNLLSTKTCYYVDFPELHPSSELLGAFPGFPRHVHQDEGCQELLCHVKHRAIEVSARPPGAAAWKASGFDRFDSWYPMNRGNSHGKSHGKSYPSYPWKFWRKNPGMKRGFMENPMENPLYMEDL